MHERDQRPVDLGAIADLLEQEIDEVGEVGIWGGYGPPSAPVSYVVRLVLENATAIENQTGDYERTDTEEATS
jgi:hypothetical protein